MMSLPYRIMDTVTQQPIPPSPLKRWSRSCALLLVVFGLASSMSGPLLASEPLPIVEGAEHQGTAASTTSAKIIDRRPVQVDGKEREATFLEVLFPPGVASVPHRHPGLIFGYVLEGRFRFALDDEPEKVLQAGDVFHEPAGALHRLGESADPNNPARVLVILLAEPGSPVLETP